LYGYLFGLTRKLLEKSDLSIEIGTSLARNFLDKVQYKKYYRNLRTVLLLPPVKSRRAKKATVAFLAPIYKKYFSHFDLLHLNDVYSPYNHLILDNAKPKILTFHEGTFAEERRQDKLNLFDNMLSRMDTITTPSNFMSAILRKKLGYRSEVIPFGVDRQLFNTSIPNSVARVNIGMPKNEKIVLWCGRLIQEKELETMIEAIPRIAHEFPSSTFLILAQKSEDKKYADRILKYVRNKAKEYPNIILKTDYVPYRQMSSYYRSADVFVHTSRVESFGLVLVEAMACGLPIIATSCETCREVVGSSGLLFERGDSQTLAEKTCMLLADDELRMAMSEAGRLKVCKTYTWDRSADQLLKVYSRFV